MYLRSTYLKDSSKKKKKVDSFRLFWTEDLSCWKTLGLEWKWRGLGGYTVWASRRSCCSGANSEVEWPAARLTHSWRAKSLPNASEFGFSQKRTLSQKFLGKWFIKEGLPGEASKHESRKGKGREPARIWSQVKPQLQLKPSKDSGAWVTPQSSSSLKAKELAFCSSVPVGH